MLNLRYNEQIKCHKLNFLLAKAAEGWISTRIVVTNRKGKILGVLSELKKDCYERCVRI